MSEAISGAQLRSLIQKLESLERDKAHIADLIKDTYAEAKNNGFDVKILRQLIRLRRMKEEEVAEQEELLEIYKRALEET